MSRDGENSHKGLSVDSVKKEQEFDQLSKRQLDRIEYLLKNPGGEEFEFFKSLIGKTPAQVMRMIAEEYVERFQPLFGLEFIQEKLKIVGWDKADLKLRNFAVTLRSYYKARAQENAGKENYDQLTKELMFQYERELDFWDKMRYLAAALPRNRERSQKHKPKSDILRQHPKHGWHYRTCRLCWRAVPVHPDLKQKTAALCFEHDLPARHNMYRRLNRLSKTVSENYDGVLLSLKPLFPRGMAENSIKDKVLWVATSSDSPLPCLVKYLSGLGHTGQPDSILKAFHGPFTKNVPAIYQQAMDKFFHEVLDYPMFLDLDELSLAEAWLRTLRL